MDHNQRTILLVFGTVAGATLLSVLLVFWTGLRVTRANHALLDGERMAKGVEDVLSTARDAETGQRGFLLTGDRTLATAASSLVTALFLLWAYRRIQRSIARNVQAAAAEAQKQLLSATLASIGDAVLTTDAAGRVVFLNAEAQRLTGWTSEEASGQPLAAVFRIVNEQTRQNAESPAERVLREGVVVGLANHTLLIAKDGRETPIHDSGAPIRQADGAVHGVVLVFRDASRERESQEAMARLAAIVKFSEDAILSKDLAGKVLTWNAAAERTFGYRADEIVGSSISLIVPSDRTEEERQIFQRLQQGEAIEHFETVRVANDGRQINVSVSISPLKDPAGRIVGASTIVRDITRYKQAEEDLRRTAQRLDLLSTAASQLLATQQPKHTVQELCAKAMAHLDCHVYLNYLLDPQRQKLHLNASAGIAAEVASRMEWLDFGAAICGCAARDRCPVVAENVIHSTDPRTQLMQAMGVAAYACHPLLVDDQLIGTLSFGSRTKSSLSEDDLALMHAISDLVAVGIHRAQLLESVRQRAAEAEEGKRILDAMNATLEQQVCERTALADQLADQLRVLAAELTRAEERERRRIAYLLHEQVQQLLVAARMRLAMIQRSAGSEQLDPLFQETAHIISQALAESRLLAVELSPPALYVGGLAAGLEWLARHTEEQHGLPIEVSAMEGAEPADESVQLFLFHAVRELVLNIIKHAHAASARIELARTQDNWLQLVVADTGVGFAFPESESSKTSSGFGLFSIRERVKVFGGSLEVESVLGEGTRILIEVPTADYWRSAHPIASSEQHVARGSHASEPTAGDRTPSRQKRVRVLLCDDHVIVRQGLTQVLAAHPDIEIVGQAENGRQAIEAAMRTRPEVVLMDVSMPVMDGIEATRRIRNVLPEVRIIGLSMHEEPTVVAAMHRAGAVAHLSKDSASQIVVDAILG